VFLPVERAAAGREELTASGRWSFCSNADHCDWLMGGCVVLDGDEPRMLPERPPRRPPAAVRRARRADPRAPPTWEQAGRVPLDVGGDDAQL
jgi:hypothetical protein